MIGAVETLLVRLKADASRYNVVLDKAVDKLRGTAARMAAIQQRLAALDKRVADTLGKSMELMGGRVQRGSMQITRNLELMHKRLGMTIEAAKRGASVDSIIGSLERLDQRLVHTTGLMAILEKDVSSSIDAMISNMSNKSAIELAKINRQVGEFAKGLRFLGYRMTLFVTLPLVALGANVIKTFADFDQAMTRSTAIMQGLSKQTKEAMKQQTFSIAKNSTTGITELAAAYYDLTSAGLDAGQTIKALPVVEKFAVAGAFDLSKATDMLATAQAALGMRMDDPQENMEQMVRITDVLTKADITANASVEEFATALVSKSGAALRLNNKSLEEGVAILAAYADQGVKGELAGERLAIMLRDLQTASINNRGAWNTLGVSVFDAGGNMRSIANIIEDLEGKFAGASDEQKKMMLMQLGFTDRSVHAVSSLIGVSDAIREYERELNNAAGTTQEVADKQLLSFSAQWTMLANKIDIVKVQIGEALAPILGHLNSLLSTAVEWFSKLPKPAKLVVAAFIAFVAAIGPILLLLGLVGGAISGIVTGVMALTTVIGSIMAFLGPLLPVIAAVAAVGVAIGVVLTALMGIAAWVIGPDGLYDAFWKLTEVAKNFVMKAIGFFSHFKENMAILFLWVRNNWVSMLTDAMRFFFHFIGVVKDNSLVMLETVFRLFNVFTGWLIRVLGNVFNYIFGKEMILQAAKGLGALVGLFMKFAKEQGNLLLRILQGDFRPEATFLGGFIQQMESDIKKGFRNPNLLSSAKKVLSEQMKKLRGPLDGFEFTTPGPAFNFGTGTGSIGHDILGGLKKRIVEIKEETETPITIRFRVTGIEAVRAGSAEAMRLLETHRSIFRGTEFKIPRGGEAGAASGIAPRKYSSGLPKADDPKALMLLEKIANNTQKDKSRSIMTLMPAEIV